LGYKGGIRRSARQALPSHRVTLLAAEPTTPGGTVDAVRAPAKVLAFDEGRRRLLTTFALDLAAAGSSRQSAAAARLAEWACAYVRSHTPLDDFDRAWQLAALAVIEGGVNARATGIHLDHAKPVFTQEPRLLLAEGIAEEATTAPIDARASAESLSARCRLRYSRIRGSIAMCSRSASRFPITTITAPTITVAVTRS